MVEEKSYTLEEIEVKYGIRLAGARRRVISSPHDAHMSVWESLRPYDENNQEAFLVMSLDSANRILNKRVVTVGLLNQTNSHPREVYKWAIAECACSIIVAHNHPSGELKASYADLHVTKRLVEAGNIIGIPVLDHLIVSKEGMLSVKDKHPSCFSQE